MSKILVVDDEPDLQNLIRQKFRQKIRDRQYEFLFAMNGIEALSLRRLDYTVIGDVVNTAQRLQSVAAPGQIIINDNSFQKVKDSFACRHIGEVQLKNKSKPVVVYEVMG